MDVRQVATETDVVTRGTECQPSCQRTDHDQVKARFMCLREGAGYWGRLQGYISIDEEPPPHAPKLPIERLSVHSRDIVGKFGASQCYSGIVEEPPPHSGSTGVAELGTTLKDVPTGPLKSFSHYPHEHIKGNINARIYPTGPYQHVPTSRNMVSLALGAGLSRRQLESKVLTAIGPRHAEHIAYTRNLPSSNPHGVHKSGHLFMGSRHAQWMSSSLVLVLLQQYIGIKEEPPPRDTTQDAAWESWHDSRRRFPNLQILEDKDCFEGGGTVTSIRTRLEEAHDSGHRRPRASRWARDSSVVRGVRLVRGCWSLFQQLDRTALGLSKAIYSPSCNHTRQARK